MNKKKLTQALCRKNLFYFTWKAFEILYPGKKFHSANHIKLMCFTLTKMLKNPGQCELFTLPPRYCKSFVVSICFVAWIMGKDPSLKVLVASYGDSLATDHAKTFRTLVESDWFKEVFPDFDLKGKKANNLTTTSRGYRKAISVNGAVTGFGADIIIIDDILKAAEARSETSREGARNFLNEGLYSRLDNKKTGHIVAIQQRLHEDDPAAYMADKGFDVLCLRAIAEEDEQWDLGDGEIWHRKRNEPLFPELEDLETLEATRARITPSVFSTQYQQNPVNPGGNQIDWSKLQFYPQPFPRDEYLKVIQSWDTACTNEPASDYSACATLGYHHSGIWHVLDIHRARYNFIELEAAVIRRADVWRPQALLIETANTGYALLNRIQRHYSTSRPSLTQMMVQGISPRLGKEERFFVHQGWLEGGLALLPEQAPWLSDLRHEIVAFPSGAYDDQIDALFQIFAFLELPRGHSFMDRNPISGRSRGSTRRIRR